MGEGVKMDQKCIAEFRSTQKYSALAGHLAECLLIRG
jgi:hypothetical protein